MATPRRLHPDDVKAIIEPLEKAVVEIRGEVMADAQMWGGGEIAKKAAEIAGALEADVQAVRAELLEHIDKSIAKRLESVRREQGVDVYEMSRGLGKADYRRTEDREDVAPYATQRAGDKDRGSRSEAANAVDGGQRAQVDVPEAGPYRRHIAHLEHEWGRLDRLGVRLELTAVRHRGEFEVDERPRPAVPTQQAPVVEQLQAAMALIEWQIDRIGQAVELLEEL